MPEYIFLFSLVIFAIYAFVWIVRAALTDSDKSPWRRFWARTLDSYVVLFAYNLLITPFGIVYFMDNEITLTALIGYMLGYVVSYVLYESFMLSRFHTTVAKWAFGISLHAHTKNQITFKFAFKRLIKIFIYGQGAMIPIVNFFTHRKAFYDLVENGRTKWDQDMNLSVHIKDIHWAHYGILVGLTFMISSMGA